MFYCELWWNVCKIEWSLCWECQQHSSQIISVARFVNTQQTCFIVYLVDETWLSNIWKTTDDDSSSVRVNWRKTGKVLTHFLQVLQVLTLTFHYSGHPGEIQKNSTWMGSVLIQNRRKKCHFQFKRIHLKTWSKKYYVMNMSVINYIHFDVSILLGNWFLTFLEATTLLQNAGNRLLKNTMSYPKGMESSAPPLQTPRNWVWILSQFFTTPK